MTASLHIRVLLALAIVLLAGPLRAQETFDLIIRNGKVIDGTGNPWFYADIAIRDGKIVQIRPTPARSASEGNAPSTREGEAPTASDPKSKIQNPKSPDAVAPTSSSASAPKTIDATNLIVAPGFIDMHSHSDTVLLEDGHAQSKIRQGVTTEVLGEGSSAGPRVGKLKGQSKIVEGLLTTWSTLGEYFQAVEKAGISVNIASYIGLDNAWQAVMGQSYDRPTKEQFAEMQKVVEQAMQDGAIGLSSMLAMPPGSLATTDDIVLLCEPVARHGGLFSTHNRNEGTGVFDAIREAIAVGERAHIPVDIIHVKIADQEYWGRMHEIVELVEAARRRGVNVQTNIYPYTRGNNNLSSIVPPWAHEGGKSQMLARLKDPKDRERMKKDIRGGIAGWYNHYTAVGGDWSRMLISGRSQYEGQTMDRVISLRTRGQNPPPDSLDVLFDLLLEEEGSVSTVYAHHTEEDMNLALAQPWCSIGSDGSAFSIEGLLRRGNPHPRNFGTFPRVLGVYVREKKLLTLEDAIRKMTSLNANKIGLRDRGLIREGLAADLCIFDPAKITDHATYTDPFQYNEGIEYVLVNGQIVLNHGTHTGAKPGKALRHAP